MSSVFSFTVSGTMDAALAEVKGRPAIDPNMPQPVADFIAAQLAVIPEDRNISLTVQGMLGWDAGQVAGPILLSMFGTVGN